MDRNNLEVYIVVFNHDVLSICEPMFFSECFRLVNLTGYYIIKLTQNYFWDA